MAGLDPAIHVFKKDMDAGPRAGHDDADAIAMTRKPQNPWLKLALDFGPLVLFFFANARPALLLPFLAPFIPAAETTGPRAGIFVATAVFMLAILAALVISYVLTRHLPVMALISSAVVRLNNKITLILHDETFIKVKPTIIYLLFAGVLGGGLLLGKSLLALVFDQMFNLTPQGWRILTFRWALFFAGMAILNEVIWRTQSTDFWVNFKVFGVTPLTMGFAITQMPLIKRYHIEPVSLEASEAEAGDVSKG